MMIAMKMKKMMTKNTIMKKPKMTNSTRKNSKNKNRLTSMRSTISSLMQERITILSYVRKNNNRYNNGYNNRNSQMQYTTEKIQIQYMMQMKKSLTSYILQFTRRLTRQTSPIKRLEPTPTGKLYMQAKKMQVTFDNNNRDLFYVIALVPHQLPGKVDPRPWHYQQSRDNAAARMRR